MNEQGCSSFSSKVNGRILDRIAGLEKIIAPELVMQSLDETGKQSSRSCRLTNEVMIWVVLAMGLLRNYRSGGFSKLVTGCGTGKILPLDRASVWHGNDLAANRWSPYTS